MKSDDYIKGVEDSASMLEAAADRVARVRVIQKVSAYSNRVKDVGEATNEKMIRQAASLLRFYAEDLKKGAGQPPSGTGPETAGG